MAETPILGALTQTSIPIFLTDQDDWPRLRATLDQAAQTLADASGFTGAPGAHLLIPNAGGALGFVVFAMAAPMEQTPSPFLFGKLAQVLPQGRYRLADKPESYGLEKLGFLLSSYEFTRYRRLRLSHVVLEAPDDAAHAEINQIAGAIARGRDLINTPANDMGPEALEQAAKNLADRYGATMKVVRGDHLLQQNFPLIHAVGRAAAQAPRLVDLSWGGDQAGEKITLVGKGVCFDTGGLDIKPDTAMLLMKKDMGGAATAMALADMIMGSQLPVRLRLILPIVENAISGGAFRPGDIYKSRKGPTIEIGNTDAEGRLILADALAYADEDAPDLLLDFATLTGAARVALGPDLPPFFTDDEALAASIASSSAATIDPVWRLPLWDPYDSSLEGKISDLNNIAPGGFAGAIIAALFLRRFVKKTTRWAHFDVYGWNPSAKPGRPEGGEIQTARLLFNMLKERIANQNRATRTEN